MKRERNTITRTVYKVGLHAYIADLKSNTMRQTDVEIVTTTVPEERALRRFTPVEEGEKCVMATLSYCNEYLASMSITDFVENAALTEKETVY